MAISVTKKNAAQAPAVAPSWMLSGGNLNTAFKQQQAAVDLSKAENDRLWRFFLKHDEERKIIFLDGNLDPNTGVLDVRGWWEHLAQVGGKWTNFVCLSGGHVDQNGNVVTESSPCPFCEGGNRSSLIAVFTVLDLTPYTIQKGQKAGTVIPFQRKLFAAKSGTLTKLQLMASKKGGLAGLELDVARTGGDKSPAVGDYFDAVTKHSMADLATKYGDLSVQPADYVKESLMKTLPELAAMGIGKLMTGPGIASTAVSEKDLSNAM